jgi:hypothetical protein
MSTAVPTSAEPSVRERQSTNKSAWHHGFSSLWHLDGEVKIGLARFLFGFNYRFLAKDEADLIRICRSCQGEAITAAMSLYRVVRCGRRIKKRRGQLTKKAIIDVGIFVVVACSAPAVSDTRRVRHLLLDHEFRRASARRPSIFTARYRDRDLFSGRFRADAPIAKLSYADAPSIPRMSGRCSRPQNSSPSSTKVGTPKIPMASAWRQICSSSCRPFPAR